jgi:CheY-like chemotaxis protein
VSAAEHRIPVGASKVVLFLNSIIAAIGTGMARILVIDDDHATRSVVTLLLERNGHQTVVAEDGRRGLKILENDNFDLLIIDIFMPVMDGLEAIRFVRQIKPAVPIIVMSGGAQQIGSMPDFLPMATKLGAIESVRKPFAPETLMAAVADCLSRSKESRSTQSG